MTITLFIHRSINRARQRGATLMTTLVMIVLVMMLGISAILMSKGQFNQAGNVQFQAAALNEAEAAAVVGEQWLATGTNYQNSGFTARVSGGMYPIGYMSANGLDPLTMSWNSSFTISVSGNTDQRYLIELLAKGKKLLTTGLNIGGVAATACNQVNVYRIVTRGVSARGATRFVQTIYSVLDC